MRGLYLSSILIILMVSSGFTADTFYKVPVSNMLMSYFDGNLSNRGLNYGAAISWRIGDDNDYLEAGENRAWWHFKGLPEAMAGVVDSIVCSLYVSVVQDAPFNIFVHRLDSTKPTPEGTGNGAVSDCGSSWTRYEEGASADPVCNDHNWVTAGGDYYATLDTLTAPTSTGWWSFRFTSVGNTQVVNYYNNIIDSTTDADSTKSGASFAVGGLIFMTNNADNDHVYIDSDNGTNTPRIYFWGNNIVPMRNVTYTKRVHQKVGGLKASMITHDWPNYSKKVHDSTDWTP